MSTIKMQQAYLSELQNSVCRAAEHSSSAANTVSKAMNGLSGMQFSSKESTIAELSSLKQRLNLLCQNGNAYAKLIEEYSDSIQAIDDNTNDASDTIIGRISTWTESTAKSLFSFSLSTQLGKQAATAGLFLGGAGLLSGITKIGKGIWNSVMGWFGKLVNEASVISPDEKNASKSTFNNIGTVNNPKYDIESYRLFQNEGYWVGTSTDIYDQYAKISAHGCLITSISMVESLYQEKTIAPPEAIQELNMKFSAGKSGRYGYLESVDGYKNTSFDLSTVYEKLKNGPVVVGGTGPYGSHYMVVTGYTGRDSSNLKLSDFTVQNPDKWTQCDTLDKYGYSKLTQIYYRSN